MFSADDAQLLAGKNIAAFGNEILQFGRAVPLGNKVFELSYLIRGLGGTESEMEQHIEDEDFILLDATAATRIEPQTFSIFQAIKISAIGRGDDVPVIAQMLSPGRALLPWSPVHPESDFNHDGDLEISWTRRSRAGLSWRDNVEVPIAEENEAYRIGIMPDVGNSPLPNETSSPRIQISETELQSYRSQGVSQLTFSVHQIGQYGLSEPLTIKAAI